MRTVFIIILTLILPITVNAQSGELYSDINNEIKPRVVALGKAIKTLEGRINKMYKSAKAPNAGLEDDVRNKVFAFQKYLTKSEERAEFLIDRLNRDGKSNWASKVGYIKQEIEYMQSNFGDRKLWFRSISERYDDYYSQIVKAYNKIVESHNRIQKRKNILVDIFGWEDQNALKDNTMGSLRIGGFDWATNNLNVTKFRNGEPIPYAESMKSWRRAIKEKKPAWCYFMNRKDNEMGVLYNRYVLKDKRGLAPKGWRIASSEDWNNLFIQIGARIKKTKSGRYEANEAKYFLTNTAMKIIFNGPFKAIKNGKRIRSWNNENSGYSYAKDVEWKTSDGLNVYIDIKRNYISVYNSTDADTRAGGYHVRCIKE